MLGEFEQSHTLLQVGLVGHLMLFDRPLEPTLFRTPLRGFLLIIGCGYVAVELIDIHIIDACLKVCGFRSQAGDRFIAKAPLVLVALA